jgi:hypothetical protein
MDLKQSKTGKMKKLVILLSMTAILSAVACKKDGGLGGGNNTPRTEVPDEIVGAWEHGTIDFELWENYREGYYAGRNSVPTREAMVFNKNGDAKFYRYEFALNLYEELIDCTGTVTFNDDGTFTFYPTKGRKRFNDLHHAENSSDRQLNTPELEDPKLAGKRGYVYNNSNPPSMRIIVPGSAPYNWYKKF